jgi:hypothetical protein
MATNDELTKQQLRRRLLGRAPELRSTPLADLGRDLVFVLGADGTRDLSFVEGIDNLSQSLQVAFTTPLVGDVFNTQFGFDGLTAFVSETVPVRVKERIRIGIVTLLRKDPRVRRIVDIKPADDRLQSPGAGSRTLEVKVVFETVSADQAAVQLGPGGINV